MDDARDHLGRITYDNSSSTRMKKKMVTQVSTAVSPSAFGAFPVTELKMLTSTRNKVTRRAILPGMTSMGIRKDIQETITNSPALLSF